MSDTVRVTMKSRFVCEPEIGMIFVPDLDGQGAPQSTGLLLADEAELRKRDPPVWCIYGPEGWYMVRKIENKRETT